MLSFDFQCATRILFGLDMEKRIGGELARMGASRVLLVYGGKSIRRSGLYDTVTACLKEAGLAVFELAGVVPNPRVSRVREGIALCRSEKIDCLLAVGGGSCIDTCKAVSYGVYYDGDVWDLICHKARPGDKHLPVATILTLPAAGSEASDSCVISDETIPEKSGFGAPGMRPVLSILNPALTTTLPPFQTACGAMDIMAHDMERYFSQTPEVELTDRLSEAILQTIIHQLPRVLAEPDNIAARSEIMWAGTLAQNDVTGTGRQQDWANHIIEHQISGIYDIAHGAGLAITFPAWMTYLADKPACQPKLCQYARRVWGLTDEIGTPRDIALAGAEKLRGFIRQSGLPTRFADAGIDDSLFMNIANTLTDGGKATIGSFYPLDRDAILAILTLAK